MGKAPSPPRTNAARLLDRLGVSYELRTYPTGGSHRSAAEVARAVGLDPATVFKTLLGRGDRHGLCFAVVPATHELDLKALARASGDRSVSLVPLKELTALTGYVRGGVTALAAKKSYPVYLHESARSHPRIAVSGGKKGLQIVLSPADYQRVTEAVWFG